LKQSNISNPKSGPLDTFVKKLNVPTMEDKILAMIVKDNRPFSIVEDEGFKELIQHIIPNYTLPTRKTLTCRFIEQFHRGLRRYIPIFFVSKFLFIHIFYYVILPTIFLQ
jgi:hypothetical protein